MPPTVAPARSVLQVPPLEAAIPPRFASAVRSSSPGRCAVWHALFGLLLLLLPACDNGDGTNSSPSRDSRSPRERIDELVQVFTPLAKTVTSDKTDAQFIRGEELLRELSAAGPAVGNEALARLKVAVPEKRPQAVERALLIVGARAAPDDSAVLLENLVKEFGTDIALRTEATLLLSEVHPARALEVLEPFVRRARQNQTLPPQEFLVRAYVTACERTKTDPVPAMADVAANLFMDEPARVRAVKELGTHTGNRLAEKALSAILVESTGDGYLRRMAAQSLLAILPRESACSLLTQVAGKEADVNMQLFLKDMLDKNCAKR